MNEEARVLIVDDEELLRSNMRAFFEDLGYRVVEAANGREGLEVLADERPDIVFTDLRMPEMDGLAFITALRETYADLPVIVISGTGTLGDAIEAIRRGAWDYVTKPFQNMECLAIATQRSLERARLIVENKTYREHLEEMVRHRTEELQDSEARFRTLFESASDAIILLCDERIVACNRRALEMFDCSRKSILDRTLVSLSPDRQPDGAPSADRIKELMQAALAWQPQFYEWRHIRASGEPFDAEISLNRMDLHGADYFQAIIRDISLRKQKDAQILKLSTAVTQSASMVMITDPLGRIEYVNPKFTEVTGYAAVDVIGKTPSFLKSGIHPPEFYQDLLQCISSGQVWEGEFCNRKHDGTLYWDKTTIAPVRDTTGALTNFIAVKEDITRHKRYEERLYEQANYDTLTGLPNRYLLAELITAALEKATVERSSLFLLLLGVDNFKHINDTQGHFQGDHLLQQMAGRLRKQAREGDTAARFVGDEFVMLLTSTAVVEEAALFARDLQSELAAPYSLGHTELYATVSIGVVDFQAEGETAETMLRNAETAMFEAKKQGSSHILFFTQEIDDLAKERFTLGTRLHKALERAEFTLYYQPQFDLASRQMVSMEALLRWQPAGGMIVSPDLFVPILEETGLIVPVGEWVLMKACCQLREWLDAGLAPLPVSVNISAWQFHGGRLPETVRQALEASRLDPALLCLELTESIVMRDIEETIRTLQVLTEMGVSLSIDDFGTGYSSLSYLRRMPIHELKIDRSFVSNLPQDANSVAIVSTILAMAASLNLCVVAEGVETEEQHRFLTGQNCLKGQGYLFSRPLPAEVLFSFAEHWVSGSATEAKEHPTLVAGERKRNDSFRYKRLIITN